MKSLLKIKIIGREYRTMRKKTITKKLTCDHMIFTDITLPAIQIGEKGKGHVLPETILTAKAQADEWVSSQVEFLRGVIYDPQHDLGCIENWEIVAITNFNTDGSIMHNQADKLSQEAVEVAKPAEDPLQYFMQKIPDLSSHVSDELILNFAAVYQEMKTSIAGLSKIRQFNIVLASLSVGTKAGTVVCERITSILKEKPKRKTLDDYYQNTFLKFKQNNND
jgi:hypothetical protein